MGKSKRNVDKSALPPKRARTLPPVHESQERLAQRAAAIGEDHAIILVGPPGAGKTRVVGRYIRLRQEQGGVSLTLYVGANAYMCSKQGFEIGSDFQYSFQHYTHHRQIRAMLMQGRSVVTAMTPAMFGKIIFGDAQSREEFDDPLFYFKNNFLSILQGTPCTTIRVVLDEMHNYFDKAFPAAIKAVRRAAKSVALVVTGLTATPPDFEQPSPALKAMTRCDQPTIVTYTDEERAAFDKDLRPQPPVGAFKTIKMADPSCNDAFADSMAEMATLLVGAMLVGEKTIKTRQCLQHVTSKVLARLAHEGGGQAFQCVKEQPMHAVGADGTLAAKFTPHHEALVIAHATLCGASTAFVELSTLKGQEDVRDFSVHDLRASEIAALDDSIAAFKAAFKAQEKPALAIVNPTMRHSTNAFASNTSGVIAVGHWTAKGLTQLAGRLSRPCTLEAGDIVPKEYTLVHLESDWQHEVLAIRATRVSSRSVQLPESEAAMLDRVLGSDRDQKEKATIEQNALKLAAADSKRVLGGTTMCADYLEALLSEDKRAEMSRAHQDVIEQLLTYVDAEDAIKQAARAAAAEAAEE